MDNHSRYNYHEAYGERASRASDQFAAICLQTPPEYLPDQPLRVWLVASRQTTVMQYNARDLAQGFKSYGCQVEFMMESNDREALMGYHYNQDRARFRPHIVVHINHLNNSSLHSDVFNVTWWQDLMDSIALGKPLNWRKRDLIYSINQELDTCLSNCGAHRIHRQGFCYDDHIFKDFGRKRQRKVVVIASSYRHFVAENEHGLKLLERFEAMFVAGEPMTDERLEELCQNSPLSKKDILFFVWGYVVRDLSVRLLCGLADEIEVEVYGRHWQEDEIVKPYFKGSLPHGTAVADVYNGATYALVPHLFDLQSQRLMEAVACGCLPIVYDCRYRAEQPHWDDNCLWYRTQEDMLACITQQPPVSPLAICQGRTYGDFAKRILKEVQAQLAEADSI